MVGQTNKTYKCKKIGLKHQSQHFTITGDEGHLWAPKGAAQCRVQQQQWACAKRDKLNLIHDPKQTHKEEKDKYNKKKNYRKQLSTSSSLRPLGLSVWSVWIQKASLCRKCLSLFPPLLGGGTVSMPWNLRAQTSWPASIKCLAMGDLISLFLIQLLCSEILVRSSLVVFPQ